MTSPGPVDWSKEKGCKTIHLPDGTEVADIIDYNNRKVPTFENNFIDRIDEICDKFTSRDGDILIYGFMKSGKVSFYKTMNLGLISKSGM